MRSRLRWGVLGTAKIAVQKVIPGIGKSRLCEVLAIASRRPGPAREVAQQLGVAKAYGSYEALLDDPAVDAVYIPLPNHLHVPWSLRALEAGKHVLCEKPIALSAAEAVDLLVAARSRPELKVMEAFMYRFHPQWLRTRELVGEGAVGQLRAIQSFFSYRNLDAGNIRNSPEMGGGGLMDIGCYPVSLSRFLFEREPERVLGHLEIDPRFGVDRMASGVLDFGSGTSIFTCGTQLAPFQRVHVVGEEGLIEIEIPFNAPPDRPCRIWLERGGKRRAIELEVCDQYAAQADAFANAVLRGHPAPTPLQDAVDNMRVIEALVESSRAGEWRQPRDFAPTPGV